VIDKPAGLTSHDVVARVRRVAGVRRVGHTGTLDPMATGVLVLCLGKATRLIPYLEEGASVEAKEYEALIRFGFETTTDDVEGQARSTPADVGGLTSERVRAALATFVGDLQQVPPAYSAKKLEGERAYSLARRGETVDLKPVPVRVARAELLELSAGTARVRYACSRGTYIRSLARDLGRVLGVGAHLNGLRRTRSGSFTLDEAVVLDELDSENLGRRLIPPVDILSDWPRLMAGPRASADLRLGRPVSLEELKDLEEGARVRVTDPEGALVALARREGLRLLPFCVF